MKIDIIIPNFNGAEIIKKNLPKVINATEAYEGKIIIVDDESESSDFENLKNFVSTLGSRIILLRNTHNLGFSSTVNKGVEASKADFIALLNSDVEPTKDFLKIPLSRLLDNDKLFGVGLMDKSEEGDGFVMRGRGLASWKRGLVVHRRGEVDKSDTFWISGGSSVIRRDAFVKLGGFDKLYNPFYWEDIDLSYRAQKSGYEIIFESKSTVIHRHEEGSIKTNYNSFAIKKIAYRNQFIFVWKNITDINLLLSHIVWLPYHFVNAIIALDTAFFIGFLSALAKISAIIKTRNYQLKLYIRDDSEIIKSQ